MRLTKARFHLDVKSREVAWRKKNYPNRAERFNSEYEAGKIYSDQETGYHGVIFHDADEFFEWEVVRWKCRHDLFYMAKEILGFKDFAKLHRDTCDWMQLTGDVNKRALFEPRGHYKTTMSSISYSTWLVINDPGIRIAIYTGDKGLGENIVSIIKELWTSNTLSYYFPEIFSMKVNDYAKFTSSIISLKRSVKESRKGYTVTVMSEKSGSTGFHMDFAIIDDAVHENNYQTAKAREKTKLVLDFLTPKLDTPSPGAFLQGQYLIVGTIYHWGDWYWTEVLKSVATPDQCKRIKKNPRNMYMITESLMYVPVSWIDEIGREHYIFPEKFNKKEIARRKESMTSETNFYSQYYLQPGAGSNKIFNDVFNLPEVKSIPKPTVNVIGVDWASEERRERGDKSVARAIKFDVNNNLIMDERISGNWEIQDYCEEIISLAMRTNTHQIAYEHQAMAQKTIERHLMDFAIKAGWKIQLEAITRGGQSSKVDFCKDALAGYINKKKLYVRPDDSEFLQQADEFPNGEHDDEIDAPAIAVHSEFARKPNAEEIIDSRTASDNPEVILIENMLKGRDSTYQKKYYYPTGGGKPVLMKPFRRKKHA